jgi:hypothetical protein
LPWARKPLPYGRGSDVETAYGRTDATVFPFPFPFPFPGILFLFEYVYDYGHADENVNADVYVDERRESCIANRSPLVIDLGLWTFDSQTTDHRPRESPVFIAA